MARSHGVLATVVVVTLGTACVTVHEPRASIELADVVAEQTVGLRASHEAFVGLYYSELRAKVERFMAERWVPEFLSRATLNTEFRGDHDIAVEISRLGPNDITVALSGTMDTEVAAFVRDAMNDAISAARAQLGTVLIDFGEEALRQIQLQRSALLGPINTQEQLVLSQLRETYDDLQRGQTAIRGYLASVVELQEQSDVVLEKLGLLDAQKQLLSIATDAGNVGVQILNGASGADENIGAFLEHMDGQTAAIRSILTGSQTPGSPGNNN